ncbi:MAG: 6,7-dimethyl-8-ribityllumazine synthase 1 [Pelagibacteraceae bacterium]|nr:MAG: 6,7-dimethyl-8-ribityllumazine synthase 1 [Pelagibacteraceae bacterium]
MKKKIFSVSIVVADYYKEITDSLTNAAAEHLQNNNINYEIFKVPGVYEIPQFINWKLSKKKINLFIALGCVIKGDTYHFEVISDAVGQSLLDISSSNSKTIISNGIINAYSESQAKKRSKADSKKNKGFEAASAMVRMIECLV